jgi:microcin C transport system substrate-binding protein
MRYDLRRGLTRRDAVVLGGAALLAAALPPIAWGAGRTGLHGLSIFGELKYPRDFKKFDYVNAAAPKGGRMNFQPGTRFFNENFLTFNTLNAFVLKGDAPPRMSLTFDSLLTSAGDEADSMYGLLAETIDVSDDGHVYTFHLRRGVTFSDGSPLSAADVAFSLRLLKDQGHPNLAALLKPVAKAEAPDPATVVVTLDGTENRETILSVGGMPVFSKAYYASHPFDSSSLDVPLGSGPYRVGDLSAGRYIEYRRRADYWGKDLAVNVGFANFDAIRIDFFQERQTQFEAFKKGDITFREEFTSITWAQEYNFPAVVDGRVKKALFPQELSPSLQHFFVNNRLKKLSDPRTREAIGLAFDFEWSNQNLFFGIYTREVSFFENSDFKAVGKPSPAEVALLEPYRGQVPDEVFGEVYIPPKTDGSGKDRALLRRASDLLTAAGWKLVGNRIVDPAGAPLTIEFLIDAAAFIRVLSPWVENLRAIGIEANIREVDGAQYAARVNNFDFDIILGAFGLTPTPLNGFDQLYGSAAADQMGSDNQMGIKSKAIDGLIDKLRSVNNRQELVTILKAMDRVLRAGRYSIPSWYAADHKVAHWAIFGWPEKKPDYVFNPEVSWWFDADKARAIGYRA